MWSNGQWLAMELGSEVGRAMQVEVDREVLCAGQKAAAGLDPPGHSLGGLVAWLAYARYHQKCSDVRMYSYCHFRVTSLELRF
jgi:predicted lipase